MKFIYFIYQIFIVVHLISLPSMMLGQSNEHRIIVKFKESDKDKNDQIRRDQAVKKTAKIGSLGLELWTLQKDTYQLVNKKFNNLEEHITFLNLLPEVDYAEPDYMVSITETIPNDPEFAEQWALKNIGQNGCIPQNSIQATIAWDLQTSCDRFPIGIIDTGIDWTHPDLIDNIWQNLGEDTDGDSTTIEWDGTKWILDPGDLTDSIDNDGNGYINDLIGWDFVNDDNNPMDDDGHGTHVAGIIGAKGNNGIGISGVCWDAQLMALKGLNKQGTGYVSQLILAIDYAVNMGVKITNNSWSLNGNYSQALFEAIQRAQSRNQLFVTAAGNNGANNDIFPVYPASYNLPNIFTVGAANCQDKLPEFGNYGEQSVDIMAPGDGIYSTQPNLQYSYKSGTSMAAPFVTGAAALMVHKFPLSTARQLKETIIYLHSPAENFSEKCVAQGTLDISALLNATPNLNIEGEVWQNFPSAHKDVTTVAEVNSAFWFGTSNDGLIKLSKSDSTELVIDTLNSDLVSNRIRKVIAGANQSIWVTFYDTAGIQHISDQGWAYFQAFNSPLGNKAIHDFKLDTKGSLWVGTDNGLFRFDGYSWTSFYPSNSGITGSDIREMEIDRNDNIWLFTELNPKRLVKYDGNSWQIFDFTNAPFPFPNSSLTLDGIAIDANNHVWLFVGKDLVRYNQNNWFLYAEESLPDLLDGYNFAELRAGQSLWMTGRNSLHKFENGSWVDIDLELFFTRVGYSGVIENTHVPQILFIDGSNRLWVSLEVSSNRELFIFDESTWKKALGGDNGYGGLSTSSITVDVNGNVWVAGRYNSEWGISKYDGSLWEHFNTSNSDIASNSVYHMNSDSSGNLWIGTSHGLCKYDTSGNWTTYNSTNSDMQGMAVFSVFVDDAQRIWAFTDTTNLSYQDSTGWAIFDGTNWFLLSINNAPTEETYKYQMDQDSQGNYWMGTRNGLVKFHANGRRQNFTQLNSPMPGDYVHIVLVDLEDNIWVATDGGLVQYDGTSWTLFTINDSPFDSTRTGIAGMAVDSRNNIWLAGGGGLFKYNRETWTEYDLTNSGLTTNNVRGMAIDQNDRLWFASDDGLDFLDPASLISFSGPVTVCLDQEIVFSNESSPQNVLGFEWQVNDVPVSTDTNLVYMFNDPGVYKITLVANDTITGERSFSQFLTAQAPVALDLGPDTTACAERIYLDVGIGNAIYAWENIHGDTLSEEQGIVIDSTGTYAVSITDACGFTAQDTISVSLTEEPIGSCVWPGDINANGWVNMIDFLVLGAANGATGLSRNHASLAFEGQASEDWQIPIQHAAAQGVDMKHADSNGDGFVDIVTDAAAILRHAQGSHRSPPAGASATNRLRIRPVEQSLQLGEVQTFKVYLDNAEDGLVSDAYGLAFSMEHNLRFSENPVIRTERSWLGTQGDDMSSAFIKYPYHFDVGLTRSDQFSVSDSGEIAQIDITILAEDIEDTSKFVTKVFLTMKSVNAVLMEQNGKELSINSLTANTMETFTLNISRIELDLNVWLQGAYDRDIMRTELNKKGLLTSKHPYAGIYQPLLDSIPPEVVDWIVVELRYPENPSKVVAKRAAWLMADGSIIDPEDGGTISLVGTTGFYYVSIRHRNHLAIMSARPLLLSPNQVTQYDFGDGPHQALGQNAQIALSNGKWAMYAGDVNADGKIAYSGPNNDRAKILALIGGNDLTAIRTGYLPEDTNLDGIVKYSGSKNDRAIILSNIGDDDPTDVIQSYIPN